MELIFIYIGLALIVIFILYILIKAAVKNGVKEALYEIKIEQLEDYSFIVSGRMHYKKSHSQIYPDPLFEDNPDKSEKQKKLEKETYILYSKRKLRIDYNDTIENQKNAIRKIVEGKMNE